MTRASWVSFIPDEWNEREKKGQCPVCGVPKSAFEPGLKKYCSDKCKKEYADKIIFWDSLRYKALERDHYTCQSCGINQEKATAEFLAKREKWRDENFSYLVNNPEFLEKYRQEQEEKIQRYLDGLHEALEIIASPETIADHVLAHDYYEVERLGFKLPHENYREKNPPRVSLEVDHIKAIANEGDQWDINNLQTLCTECHKKKTYADMQKIKLRRKKQVTLVQEDPDLEVA